MLIQCTKKLLDELHEKPQTDVDHASPLFSWHAKVITVNRRKAVVVVNDNNRYVVVLYGLKAKDIRKLNELIVHAIRQTFREEGIKDDVIEQYLETAGAITFSKTKNRTTVARLNKASEVVQIFDDLLQHESLYQTEIGMRVSRHLVTDGDKDYIYPNEEMYKELEIFSGGPIISSQAAVLMVTLELENHEVSRKIIVPANITFDKVHMVIQRAFGWKNMHLHEFYILGKEGQPIVNLVGDNEALAYEDDLPVRLEDGTKLSEYLPATMKYVYDYGDDWVHRIEIEKVITDYDKNYPVCLEAHGNAPPEDVGGEGGYEEFLDVIADERHPDHEEMKAWGRMQGYQDVNIKEINFDLKRRL